MIITENDIKLMVKNVLDEVRYIDAHYRDNRETNYVDDPLEKFKKVKQLLKDYGWGINKIIHNKERGYIYILTTPGRYLNGEDTHKDFIKQSISVKYQYTKQKCQIKDLDNGGLVLYLPYVKDSNWSSINKNESIRVFHATDVDTAIKAALYGLSGKEQVSRTYSYEKWMNPTGLFVTTDPSFSVVSKNNNFGYHYCDVVILEFTANEKDLDTPVWNGQDTYFGAYTNPQPFTSRAERVIQKNQYKADAAGSNDYVKKSNNPAMAEKIFNNPENQALYFGDLNPNQIKRFWVRKYDGNGHLGNPIPMSRKQFLNYYKDKISKEENRNGNKKILPPNANWPGAEGFANIFVEKYPDFKDFYDGIVEKAKEWEDWGCNNIEPNPYQCMRLMEEMNDYLFPKQILDIIGIDKYREHYNMFYPEFNV